MSPKNQRKGAGQEYYMKERCVSEMSPSFNVRDGGGGALEVLSRPRSVPDILDGKRVTGLRFEDVASKGKPSKPTKLLLKVTIERILGPVQVVMSPEASVKDLISAVLLLYVKEGRRPLLPSTDAADFELHYSQFSLESLKVEEKLIALGSRNFFLCRNTAAGIGGAPPTSSCSRAAKKQGLPWLKFMDFNF
ncbi:uncharacterized protein At4g22758-like [Primulina eburnea]|uniref:uncharacterized protein At4g22758-like n=1 Tax=Primulina eburnea TaxID=1245227 RepID=UPI003C6BF6EC